MNKILTKLFTKIPPTSSIPSSLSSLTQFAHGWHKIPCQVPHHHPTTLTQLFLTARRNPAALALCERHFHPTNFPSCPPAHKLCSPFTSNCPKLANFREKKTNFPRQLHTHNFVLCSANANAAKWREFVMDLNGLLSGCWKHQKHNRFQSALFCLGANFTNLYSEILLFQVEIFFCR